jgi:crotonobetainyl-CoA:carnitine CoA-transferase CaiB-like acyl-CoA transferase
MTMLATPADFQEHPARPRFRAPRLGEHSRQVLDELGYAPGDIEALVAGGAVLAEVPAPGI